MTARKSKPYDPAKRYAVTMARVKEHDGFVFKPGPEPIEMAGELANALSADIAEAQELAPAPEQPAPQVELHETAED